MQNRLNSTGRPAEPQTPPVQPRRRRDPVLLLAAVLALAWLIYSGWTLAARIAGVPNDLTTDALVAQLGAAVEVVMIVPYLIAAVLAVVCSWLAWWLNRRWLALLAAILLIIAVLLGLKNGFGMLPGAMLTFSGAARLKRQKASRRQA